MTEFVSSHPDNPGSPEELLFRSVGDLLDDPILPRMINDARHFERKINVEGLDEQERARIINYLDGQWPYMQQPITIAGRVFTHDIERGGVRDDQHTALQAISHGFDVMNDAIVVDGESVVDYYRICYFLFINNEDGSRARALAPVDDSIIMQLPFASRDLREQRVHYLFPSEVEEIDSCMFNVEREDQVLKALGDYRVDVDFNSESDTEKRDDLVEYIRATGSIDLELPYFVSIRGPILVPDGAGMAVPHYLENELTGLASVRDIAIRPGDVRIQSEGVQTCTPFVMILLHSAHSDRPPRELIVPCSSIHAISSVRYLTPPANTDGSS